MSKNLNADWLDRRAKVVARGLGMAAPIIVARAENSELWDLNGRRFIDFGGGIAVLNTGHRHPLVMKRVLDQLNNFTHTCFMVTPYAPFIELAEKLCAITPISGDKKAAFLTTGAEAVENAVKIARSFTRRSDIIAFHGGFHGRTLLGMGLTGKVVPYKTHFGPMPSGIWHVPFPDEQCGTTIDQSVDALNMLFSCSVEPSNVAAIIIEPVQGEGGFYVAPKNFIKRLRALCDLHGIVLIADEIQSGFGRTGTWFAMDHYPVEADLITVAKSLAGGFPLSGVVGRAKIMDAPEAGALGGTYAGNPVACAAALGVFDAFEQEHLLEKAQKQGKIIMARLEAIKAKEKTMRIGDIRGLGAMCAFDLFSVEGDGNMSDSAVTKALVDKCLERGLLILSCGLYGNSIRLLPPLTASDAVLAEGLDHLEAALLGS